MLYENDKQELYICMINAACILKIYLKHDEKTLFWPPSMKEHRICIHLCHRVYNMRELKSVLSLFTTTTMAIISTGSSPVNQMRKAFVKSLRCPRL